MLVTLQQVLKVPAKAHLLIADSEAEAMAQHESPLQNCQNMEWMHYQCCSHHDEVPAVNTDGQSYLLSMSTQNREVESFHASPPVQAENPEVHEKNTKQVDSNQCNLKEGRGSCPTADVPVPRKRRRGMKSKLLPRQLSSTDAVDKIAENFKVNYREVVRTVRDAVFWLKRAWRVIKQGKVASYFALERLVQAVQGPVKVKNSYSCKRQECLRMIVWCFVLGPDKLRKIWDLDDPDRVLNDGLLYSSKKVGGLSGISGEFRKWERKEGYVDCRQDRERGAMVHEDEFVISHFEAKFGVVNCD